MNIKNNKWMWIIVLGFVFFISSNQAYAADDPAQASELYFYDESDEPGSVRGKVKFKPATDISNITHYAVYFTNSSGEKIQHAFDIEVAEAQAAMIEYNENHYSYFLGERVVPEGATQIGIFSKNANQTSKTGAYTVIWDKPTQKIPYESTHAVDKNPLSGETNYSVSWAGLPDESRITGYQIKYTTRHYNVAEPYSNGLRRLPIEMKNGFIVKKGDNTAYEINIPKGDLPLHAYYLQVFPVHESGKEGFSDSVSLYDDISGTPAVELTPTSGLPYAFIMDRHIEDTDERIGYLSTLIKWVENGSNYNDLDTSTGGSTLRYAVYFLDKEHKKLKGIYAMDRQIFKLDIQETVIPSGAQYIGVFAETATAQGTEIGLYSLWDADYSGYFPRELTQWDSNANSGVVDLELSWLPALLENQFEEYRIHLNGDPEPMRIIPVGKSNYSMTLQTTEFASSIKIVPGRKNENNFNLRGYFEQQLIQNIDLLDNKRLAHHGTWRWKVNQSIKGFIQDEDPAPGKVSFLLPRETRKYVEYAWLDATQLEFATIGYANSIKENEPISHVRVPKGTPIPSGAVFIQVNYTIDQERKRDIYAIRDLVGDAPVFPDVDPSSNEAQAISNLSALGIINGYDDGGFHGSDTLTRAEFAVLLQRAFRLNVYHKQLKSFFSDVQEGKWYSDAIIIAHYLELLKGDGDRKFRPNDTITRNEMAVVLARLLKYADPAFAVTTNELSSQFDDAAAIPSWALESTVRLQKAKILPSDGKFGGDINVTRAECAYLLEKLMKTFQLIE